MGTSDWVRRLREGTGKAECRLPTELTFNGAGDTLTVAMREQTVSANMQNDGAAFEVWILAFLAHCGVQRVHLETPIGLTSRRGGERHVQRLLYRLERFAELFPRTFSYSAAGVHASVCSGPERLFLNAPVGHREANLAALTPFDPDVLLTRESDLEIALERSPSFKTFFALDRVMRQWPVGVFRGRVANANHVFTGGKSAIDLIGIGSRCLMLFELKKSGNAKAGILSEALFYASVMRDALGERPRFELDRGARSPRNCAIAVADILACDRVEAVLIAPRFHPIVTPEVLALLNRAMAEHWIDRPAQFRAVELGANADDFEFREPAPRGLLERVP